ncbi:MFS transporter [Bradyrhizobium sp. Pear76]|uniref:MFS transporter n=1 Tax=Bradyrhizobium oropedii TaxID=1571201 RepID=UPI001E621DD5|nr:MFS transporter [Bradyrhizobium oropedii]MCC8961383.1 MFS transporter [Bradyrhizobium oropedii]
MRQIDLHKLTDEARFNGFHAMLLFWCTLVALLDGYDIVIAGAALPSIMKQMGVAAASAGFMLSSAIVGMAIGAVLFGTVADRIGRRRAITICVTLFTVFTVLASFAHDPITFSLLRLLTGLGLGGAVPCMVALLTEYSPSRIRTRIVTLMFTGFAFGAAMAAEMSKGLIAAYGWQVMFQAAGLSIVLVPFILMLLPESMQFLVKAGRTEELEKTVAAFAPDFQLQADDQYVLPTSDKVDGAPMQRLFREGRGFSTIMFWVATFMCLLIVYANASWLPKLMISAGHDQGTALHLLAILQVGIIVGTIFGGWLGDRLPLKKVLLAFFALATMSLGALGLDPALWLLNLLIVVVGATTVGTQFLLYAYAGQFYPAAVRSTGVGWAAGLGRIGGIVGPILVGALIATSIPLSFVFLILATVAAIAFIAVALIDPGRSASAGHENSDAMASSTLSGAAGFGGQVRH